MPREIPSCPPAPQLASVSTALRVEILTPLVGGGAIPGEIDQEFPIRPTAIRGHLRHWWRLTAGRDLGNEIRLREEEVFGSVDFASPLRIEVRCRESIKTFDPGDSHQMNSYGGRFGPVAYALFASIENGHRVVRQGVRFELTLHIPNEEELNRRRTVQNSLRAKADKPLLPPFIRPISEDVNASVRAWLAYGGIGGRTRRGCGAVHSDFLQNQLPHIPGGIYVGPQVASPMTAWQAALQVYRDFRQLPRGQMHNKTIRTAQGPKTITVPGRSYWPEADSIRFLTECSLKPTQGAGLSQAPPDVNPTDHSEPIVPKQLLPAFPRAALGLPINFHFADGPGKAPANRNRDPKDVQLYPVLPAEGNLWERADRMISPVITRPLWLEGKWHPAIVILDAPLSNRCKLRLEGANARVGGNLCHDMDARSFNDSQLGQLHPMRGQANAIDALIEHLTKGLMWTKL